MEILIGAILSLVAGLGMGWALRIYVNKVTLRRAREEAEEILGEVQEQIELRKLEEAERTQEIEMELWTKVENEMLKLEGHIEELQEIADEKKTKSDNLWQEEKKKLQAYEGEIKDQEAAVKTEELRVRQKRDNAKSLNSEFIDKLTQRLNTTKEDVKLAIIADLEADALRSSQKQAQQLEEEYKEHAEVKAKRILALAIDRFARPYCPERGIGAVHFPDANARKVLVDPEGLNIKTIQEVCGCDIIVEPENDMIGVAGYDPVRRELTRRVLERLLKEKKPVQPDFIRKIAENQRKELFNNIKRDGDAIAKELRLEGLNPEIRQMMGSLRYRYSFTQNQYFHCGEVGWLAGLLASEVGVDIKKAKRMGMLHDIGKAMDHAMDGGHAVIGADFIEARGEAPDVVHAVRSHHFDEQPATDHAFLVIAADAISGARPGARRSTMETYNQKVSELQEIAKSFEGVTDCFVLNGGRECRILVNSRRVNDLKAVELAKKIAKRIEEECNYPGQIKVVVVRETLIAEGTRKDQQHA